MSLKGAYNYVGYVPHVGENIGYLTFASPGCQLDDLLIGVTVWKVKVHPFFKREYMDKPKKTRETNMEPLIYGRGA